VLLRWLRGRGTVLAELLVLVFLAGLFLGLFAGAWLDELILKWNITWSSQSRSSMKCSSVGAGAVASATVAHCRGVS